MTYVVSGNSVPRSLERKIGLGDSVFLVIGAVFGSGIFLTTGVIAAELPSPGLIWMVWLAGGILTMMGALTYAELGALYPKSGGPYLYLREAFGETSAFVFGWTFFWIISGGGVAALAMGFAEYIGSLVPALSAANILIRADVVGHPIVVHSVHLVAVAAILLLTAVNAAGIRAGVRFQNIMTVGRLAALAVFIVFGFAVARRIGGGHLVPLLPEGPWPSWSRFGAAFLAVIWTYDGWYAVNCTAEEVRTPSRTIPLSLVLGTAAVMVLYLAANIVYSMALSVNEMSGVTRIGAQASQALFGPSASALFAAFIALAILGCLGANILFCPRVAFAMARDGLFFRSLGRIHPRFGVPSRAIAAQGLWAALLCFSGTYGSLIEFVSFALVLFFAATGIALFVLRRKAADRPRPFRAWGYPWVPALFVLVNLGIFAAVVAARPGAAAIGLGLILAGLPAFVVWRKLRRDSLPAEDSVRESP
jgi:APA family basic amino acid/polyamine antiporter